MRTESQFRNESTFKYPSLEPVDLESSDSNETLPASNVITSTRVAEHQGTVMHGRCNVPNMYGEEWRCPLPSVPPYMPSGLDILTDVDHLFVDQKVELLEAVTGFKLRNKYSIKNNLAQKIFAAIEETNFCGKVFFGKGRSFTMGIYDSSMNEVVTLKRPATCKVCCIPMPSQKLEVYIPPNTLIGSVEEEWSLFLPRFKVNNEFGECVLRMGGPFFASPLLCGDRDYEIYSKDKKAKVGKISKHWGGFIKEFYTDADNFGISFPMDLDVRMKAVLLGACFLIDFMYYER